MTVKLSARAQAIIDRLEVEDAERRAASRTRATRIRELREMGREIHRNVAHFRNHTITDAKNGVNAATVAAHGDRITTAEQIKEAVAQEQYKLDRIFAERARLEAEAPEPVLTAARVHTELEALGEDLVEVERPELGKTEQRPAALARFRQKVSDLKERRKEIERAPLPATHAKEAMRRQVMREASKGLPRVSGLFHGGEIEWPRLAPVAGVGAHMRQPLDAAALAVYLNHETLIQQLEEIIDVNASSFPNAMSPRERQAALSKIDAELEAAERIEAACVEALVAQGHRVFHRPDISPLAVLSYAVDLTF